MKTTIKSPLLACLSLLLVLGLIFSCKNETSDPEPEPDAALAQYKGSVEKNRKGLGVAVLRSFPGADTAFAKVFAPAGTWRLAPSAAEATTAKLESDFLNDELIEELLKLKPEDWQSFPNDPQYHAYVFKGPGVAKVKIINPEFTGLSILTAINVGHPFKARTRSNQVRLTALKKEGPGGAPLCYWLENL